MELDLVVPAAKLPVSVAEAKVQAQVTTSRLDAAVDGWIRAAVDRGQFATRRQFCTATWRAWFDDGWPAFIEVPLPPLQDVTSVEYVDIDGAWQTLAASQYAVIKPQGPHAVRGRIVPAYGVTWPSVRCQPAAIKVTFVAGYGEPDDVPAMLKLAILRDVAALAANREDVIVGTSTTEMPRSSTDVYRSFRSRSALGRVA